MLPISSKYELIGDSVTDILKVMKWHAMQYLLIFFELHAEWLQDNN